MNTESERPKVNERPIPDVLIFESTEGEDESSVLDLTMSHPELPPCAVATKKSKRPSASVSVTGTTNYTKLLSFQQSTTPLTFSKRQQFCNSRCVHFTFCYYELKNCCPFQTLRLLSHFWKDKIFAIRCISSTLHFWCDMNTLLSQMGKKGPSILLFILNRCFEEIRYESLNFCFFHKLWFLFQGMR